MAIILDMETDALLPNCTKIHCAVAYDTEKKEFKEFTPETIDKLPDYLDEIESTLSMHNGIGFDLRVLKKLLNYEYKGKYRDTLLMSRILWPDIAPAEYIEHGKKRGIKGRHSVDAWGVRLGIKKPKHDEWGTYSTAMLHRCREDVKIQTLLYDKCIEQIEKYSLKDKRLNNWNKIFEMESYFWRGMEEQAEKGWLFNIDLAYRLKKELLDIINNIDNQLISILPMRVKSPYKKPCIAFKEDGRVTAFAEKWLLENPSPPRAELVGDFTRIQYERLNVGSSIQLKSYLLDNGWTPGEFNYKKDRFGKPLKDSNGKRIKMSPKLPKEAEEWDALAEQLNKPSISLLAERSKAAHRLALLEGLINNVRPDCRIEGRMNTCGTNTSRARHSVIVNIPKSDDKVYYGKEFRELFTVDENKVLVGADAQALEARCEAHYISAIDPEVGKFLLEGDIHSINASAWGVSRQVAKGGKYAILYGCSASKLAKVLGKPVTLAEEMYSTYWDANPVLKQLKSTIEKQFESVGHLVAIDGRPLSIRYPHALINTLFQSAGAIAMKYAWCIFDRWCKFNKISASCVGNFHDEIQVETTPNMADDVGKALVNSIIKAGEILKFKVPLSGEYKIGENWSETH